MRVDLSVYWDSFDVQPTFENNSKEQMIVRCASLRVQTLSNGVVAPDYGGSVDNKVPQLQKTKSALLDY